MYTAHHTFNPNLFSHEQSTSREENSAQGWLSVDPLANEFPHLTPYNFVEGNPIMLIDPDGRGAKCETCPDGDEYDLYRQSEVEFKYNETSKKVEKATDEKLNMDEVKDPHLETLTFLKYAKQGDDGSNTMTDYFDKDQPSNSYSMVKIDQVVDGVPIKIVIVLDPDYPTSGGKVTYPNEKGVKNTHSRLRTVLRSGELKGAYPSWGVTLLTIVYPYTQEGADLRSSDKEKTKRE